MGRFSTTDSCRTISMASSITKRVETHLLLQGSNLYVLWLHFCKIPFNFDTCYIFFKWLKFKRFQIYSASWPYCHCILFSSVCFENAAQLLDFHCLFSPYTYIFTFKRCYSCQRIFMDLKINSCEVECKCTVIHSVYIKIPGIFTFATLI